MSVMPILDWVNDPLDKLRASYAAERAKITHFSASGVTIDEVAFVSGPGLKFTPNSFFTIIGILLEYPA